MTKRSQDNARPPRAFKLDQPKPAEKLKSKPKPKQKAPRKPQKIDLESDINILPDMAAEIRQSKIGEDDTNGLTPPPPETVQRRFSFSKLFFSAFLGLLSLGIGLYVDGLVRTLFERYTYLGWFGLGLTALLVFALLGIIIRELMALSRLNSIEHLRESIHEANCSQENKATQKAITELASLYKNRPDTARGRAIIQEQQGQIIDAQDYLNIAEKQLLAPLDERARKMVLDSAKRVSVVTAVSPRAVVDIAYVLMENFKLIRKLSEHYGGKPGVLGLWLEEGEKLKIADHEFEIFHCPGHAPGHIVFYNKSSAMA